MALGGGGLFDNGATLPGTGGGGNGDWLDTSGLGSFKLILVAKSKVGTNPTLDYSVEQGMPNASGVITTDPAGKLIAKSLFTQVVGGTTLPNIQIKTFRPGGNVEKWAPYIRVCWEVGGVDPDTTSWDVQASIQPDERR